MRGVRRFAAFVAIGGAVLTAGCGSLLLPASGPNSIVVRSGVPWNGPAYGLVKLTPTVINTLDEYGPRTLSAIFGDHRPPPEINFGIGDVISVTIFEAAAGGLFIPAEAGVRPGNFVTLPNQPVDTKGFISVPYAGLVPTAGKTPSQVEQEIVDRIKNRAIEPQVVVALVTQNTSLDHCYRRSKHENTPSGRIPAQPAGRASAGCHHSRRRAQGSGPRHVGRAGAPRPPRRGSVRRLIYEPGNNIWAWPGDTIYLYKEPQTYLAFGASGQQGQFQFSAGSQSSAWRMTLAEGVAAAGGLIDVQADPGSVFLYRREPRELAEKLGVDCSKMDGPTVPVVYSVSFVDPAGYFLATRMQMHNKDVIFAANAQSVEITKFAQFADTLLTVTNDTAITGINIQTWKNLTNH